MKTLKKIGNWMILVLILFFIVIRLMSNKKDFEAELQLQQKQSIAIPVTVCQPEYKSLNNSFHVPGTFQAKQSVTVIAETSGRIEHFSLKEGDYIEKNGLIAQIDNTLEKNELELARQNHEKSKRDLERYRNLKGSEAITEAQLEQAEITLQNTLTAFHRAEENFRNTEVRSPISGFATKIYEDFGHFISPGKPVVEITEINSLKLTVYLTTSQISGIGKDTKPVCFCDFIPDNELEGELESVGKKADASGRFPVTVKINNSSSLKVLPGMTGTVSFNTPLERKLLLPRNAINGSIQEPYAFIVHYNLAFKKSIRVKPVSDDMLEIVDGLSSDDIVILNGQFNLTDSSAVRIITNSKI